MHYIDSNSVRSDLGTKISHNGTRDDIRRATDELIELDRQKTTAANARATREGYKNPLSAEQIRSGSWRTQSLPLRARIAIEAAELAMQTNPAKAVALLRSSAEGAKAALQVSNYSDRDAARSVEILESLATEYSERATAIAAVKPPAEPDAPQPPAWIDERRNEIQRDHTLTADQKRRRLASLDDTAEREQSKLDADAERQAKFGRTEYLGAHADAVLSQRLAEIATDLPEEFVAGARQRLKRLEETGDDASYRAETELAESRAVMFRNLKASTTKDAEAKAAGTPAPAEGGVTLAP